MIIRQLTEADVEPLRHIYNNYVRTSTVTFELQEQTYEQMRDRLFEPVKSGFPCLVAEEDGRVSGYCAAHAWNPRYETTAEITMYLAPETCGKGVGSLMMSRIIDIVRQIDIIHCLIVCISSDNIASRRLVEKFDFKEVAYYPQIARKFGKWVDDVDYQLIF